MQDAVKNSKSETRQGSANSWGKTHRSAPLLLAGVAAISAATSAQAQGLFGELPVAPSAFQLNPPARLDFQSNPLRALQEALRSLRSDATLKSLAQIRENRFSLKDTLQYSGVQTSKLAMTHKGIEVVGGEIQHHVSAWGEQISAGVLPFDLSVSPRVSAEAATQLADSLKGLRSISKAPELKILSLNETETPKLTYRVELQGSPQTGGATLWIDAQTGELIAEDPYRLDIAPVDVIQMSRACQEVDEEGYPVGFDPSLCQKTVKAGVVSANADASARRAADNATRVATYYLNVHKRNSFDGLGTGILNLVHIGEKFSNAFWDTQDKLMAYGDGDGVELGDFTLAVDVAGHEMTHGVVSATAKLQGFGEAGALNEAFADLFGKLIAKDQHWTVGRELFIHADQNAGIRDLANPGSMTTRYRDPASGTVTRRAYPSKMSEMFPVQGPCHPSLNDKCWVHVNSTIASHAGYLMIQAVGAEKAEKVLYLTMSQFLRPTSTFRSMARAVRTACGQLYGASSSTCSTISANLVEVGL